MELDGESDTAAGPLCGEGLPTPDERESSPGTTS